MCRNRFCPQNGGEKALNRCERVTVVQTQDRCFFEKEKVYCKLTVGCRRWNVWLLVSFVAVRSRCRCVLKKVFLYRVALHELKKFVFFAHQKFSVCRKLYSLPSKASRFRNQNTAHSNYFLLLQKPPFLRTKSLSFAQTFPYSHPKQLFSTLRTALNYCSQKIPIFTNQKSFFYTNPSLIAIQSNSFPPSISRSHHP